MGVSQQIKQLKRVEVTPLSLSIQAGQTHQFTAKGYDQDNAEIAALTFIWTVNGGIGTINSNGLFTASSLGKGNVTATATYNGVTKTGNASVTVTSGGGVATYKVSGYVYISGSSQVISGVTLTLNPGGKSTSTDSTGHYSFTGVANGTYTISASKSGYQNLSTPVNVSGGDVTKDLYLSPISDGGGSQKPQEIIIVPLMLGLIGLVIVIIALVIALLFLKRKKAERKSKKKIRKVRKSEKRTEKSKDELKSKELDKDAEE